MKKLHLVSVVLIIILAGCFGRKPVDTAYYMLEVPVDYKVSDTLDILPYSLEITDVDVHPAYSTLRIAIREGANEIRYFSNHQWAVRPQQSLTRVAAEYFNLHPFFKKADTRYWNVLPDYRLIVRIHKLEIVRERRDFSARLQIDFRLYDVHEQLIVSHSNDTSRLLQRRNLDLFAGAISDLFMEQLHYFAAKVHYELAVE